MFTYQKNKNWISETFVSSPKRVTQMSFFTLKVWNVVCKMA